jgi:hypothetical protein
MTDDRRDQIYSIQPSGSLNDNPAFMFDGSCPIPHPPRLQAPRVERPHALKLRHFGLRSRLKNSKIKRLGAAARCPRASWPTTWNEFLPTSMPITAIAVLGVSETWRASLSLTPRASFACWRGWSTAGSSHYRKSPAEYFCGFGESLVSPPTTNPSCCYIGTLCHSGCC